MSSTPSQDSLNFKNWLAQKISEPISERKNMYIYFDQNNDLLEFNDTLKKELEKEEYQDPKKEYNVIIHCLLGKSYRRTRAKTIKITSYKKLKDFQKIFINGLQAKNEIDNDYEVLKDLGERWKRFSNDYLERVKERANDLIDFGYVTEKVENLMDVKKEIINNFKYHKEMGVYQSSINLVTDDIRFKFYTSNLTSGSFDEKAAYLNKSRDQHLETLNNEIERRKQRGPIKKPQNNNKKETSKVENNEDSINEKLEVENLLNFSGMKHTIKNE